MHEHRTILLLNGPNLNMLGIREPEVYGTATIEDHVQAAKVAAEGHGLELRHHQSNHEGELVDLIHAARGNHEAIIINGGAFTHYSWSIHDALATFEGPIVEVHISNPYRRESWRNPSVVTPVATGSICGFGGSGYLMAVDAVARYLEIA
jgi:3-dehydroquinate dehydratase-2